PPLPRRARGALREGGREARRHGHRLLPHRPTNHGHALRRAHPRTRGAAVRRLVPGLVTACRLPRRQSLREGEQVSEPRAYADPYVAGAGLGLVLLASFVVAGRGLGASGPFAT